MKTIVKESLVMGKVKVGDKSLETVLNEVAESSGELNGTVYLRYTKDLIKAPSLLGDDDIPSDWVETTIHRCGSVITEFHHPDLENIIIERLISDGLCER